ncbi:MAG: CbtA family protein [Pseudomonadota bacterium]
MDRFRKLFSAAALAGLIAGLFVTGLHQIGTVPVILEAETYEKTGEAPAAATADAMPDMTGHDHGAGTWEPAGGLERTAFTVLVDILTGIGFALLLVSAYALRGQGMDWRKGLVWGLAGFAVFTLAPGLGLPPELPGTEAAPLLDRQLWWVAAVVATAAGLAGLVFGRKPLWVVLGIAAMVAPHLYGAPQPAEFNSLAPESLAHQFVVAAVVTSLLFWLALGSLTGFFYKRFFAA